MTEAHESLLPSAATIRHPLRVPIWIIAAVLMGAFSLQVYSSVMEFQKARIEAARAATYEDRVTAAQELVEKQRQIIQDLVTDYQDNAYNSPRVDTIMKQQLVATEYAIVGLQLIATQNSQIIELLSAAP